MEGQPPTPPREEESRALEIPYRELSAHALRGVVDDFILREGTDYGMAEHTLEEKRQQIMRQLEQGRARIMFDCASETCTLVTVAK